jgi:cytosine/uracil/thiamine/allantoin permease
MATQTFPTSSEQDSRKSALNKRLERIGWGLFLIMLGGLWLVPQGSVPEGAWLIGAGLIMLGLNGVRFLNGIPISSFTLVLGIVAMGAGLGSLLGMEFPVFAVFLILVGVSILLKPLFERER